MSKRKQKVNFNCGTVTYGDSFSHRIKLKLIAGMHYGQWVESSATPYQSPHIRRRRSVHHEHTVSGQPQTRLLRATIQNIIHSRNKQRRLNFCLLLFFSRNFLSATLPISLRVAAAAPTIQFVHPSIHLSTRGEHYVCTWWWSSHHPRRRTITWVNHHIQ